MRGKLIGITGYARVGKNYFTSHAKAILEDRGERVVEYSFAAKLKEEMRRVLMDEFGIDILNCTPQEKELIRPVVVYWAEIRRTVSKGTYFINSIKDKVEKSLNDGFIVFITDVRFKEYTFDELDYIKSSGCLIGIRRFSKTEGGNRVYIPPAIDKEKANGPILYQNSDYIVDWETSNDSDYINDHVKHALKSVGII